MKSAPMNRVAQSVPTASSRSVPLHGLKAVACSRGGTPPELAGEDARATPRCSAARDFRGDFPAVC